MGHGPLVNRSDSVRSVESDPARNQAMRIGIALEPLTEIGMGDGDQRACSLGHRFAFEIDHAVLGHDVHGVRAWRRDDIALRKVEDDPALAYTLSFIGRGQANKGFAAFRGIGPAHKLRLPSVPADVTRAVGFGAGLAL